MSLANYFNKGVVTFKSLEVNEDGQDDNDVARIEDVNDNEKLINNNKNKISTHDDKLEEHTSQISANAGVNSVLYAKINNVESDVNDLSNNTNNLISANTSQISANADVNSVLYAKINNVESDVNDLSNNTSSANADLDVKIDNNTALITQNQVSLSGHLNLINNNTAQITANETHSSLITNLTTQINDLTNEVNLLKTHSPFLYIHQPILPIDDYYGVPISFNSSWKPLGSSNEDICLNIIYPLDNVADPISYTLCWEVAFYVENPTYNEILNLHIGVISVDNYNNIQDKTREHMMPNSVYDFQIKPSHKEWCKMKWYYPISNDFLLNPNEAQLILYGDTDAPAHNPIKIEASKINITRFRTIYTYTGI